jgi:pilus assembly protein Flp/PilA
MDKFRQFITDESAATAIEYGIIAAVIGLMLIGVMPGLEGGLAAIFDAINVGFDQVAP